MSRVTAIVPTFNRADLVGECLRSLLGQTRPPDEIIVVNDGSTDATLDTLAAFGDAIRVIDKPNGGKSTALNRALADATGDMIWICDDDDVAHPAGLAMLEAALATAPAAPFAWGLYDKFVDEAGGRRLTPVRHAGRADEPSFFLNALEEMQAFQFALLARADAYARAGPFREDLVRSQDFEMLTRLARLGEPVHVPAAIFAQRRHAGARGSASARFAGTGTHAQAIRYGGSVIRDWRRDLPLDDWTPGFARRLSGPSAERAALLQRGLTCAQRSLWSEAAEDVAAAARLATGPATADERRLAGAVIRNVVPWPILAEDRAATAAFRRIARSGRWGRAIVGELVRPLIWRARMLAAARDWRGAARAAALLVRLLGPAGSALRVADNAVRRTRR